jgi:hypothetical protein
MKSTLTGRITALLALAAVLASCASPGTSTAGSGEKGSPTVSTTASPSDSPSPSFSLSPSAGASQPGKPAPTGPLTLRGKVEAGVEAGCLVLTGAGVNYQLIGGDRTMLRAGRTVEVVGIPRPDMLTICQQGTPFEVQRARLV